MPNDLPAATRARLEHVVLGTWPILTLDRGDVLALLAAYDALRAAQAQAAPVLAAAEVWSVDHPRYGAPRKGCQECDALAIAVAAWRAAREG